MISFNEEKTDRITLDEMDVGDTFIYEDEPYMKVLLDNGTCAFINLVTGEESYFCMEDEYKPIAFELKRVKKEND